ncbi:MAG: hypothetical protein ABIK28_18190 [Planctomycetota bacterium]
MKKAIVLAIVLVLFAVPAWAQGSRGQFLITGPGYVNTVVGSGDMDIIPPTNWRFQYPEAPQVNPCPWRIKSVPESEAEKLMNEGWEPFGTVEKQRVTGYLVFSEVYIYLRKRVCE